MGSRLWPQPGLGALAVFLLATLTPVAHPAAAPEIRELVSKRFPLTLGGRVIIETHRGNVAVEAWPQTAVDLRAEKLADSVEDAAALPIEIRSAEDELVVKSRAPTWAPDLRVRVDYRVRVPADVDLRSLKTDRGDIAVTGVTGRIVVQTIAGSVRLRRVAGILKVATVNGEIDAELTRLQRGDAVVFDTYNGDIRLRLPGALRAHYALRTFNGTIESSVPMSIEHGYGPHIAHETSGVEDPLVRVTSVNGTIRIVR